MTASADANENPRRRLLTHRLVLVAAIIAAVGAVGLYAVIAWAIPRGFDWTDESWATSLIASNRNTVGEVWGFQFLLHPVFLLFGESIIAIRILRLVCYLLLTLYFVAIARAIARAKGWQLSLAAWVLILSVSQIGSFFAWSYPPRSVGYNELASWLVQLGGGAILLVVAGRLIGRPVVGPRVALMVWIGVGAIVMFLMAAKITSGILFGCVVVLALVVRDPAVRAIRRMLAVIVGAVLAFLIMVAGGLSVGAYVSNVLALAFDKNAQAAGGHSVGTLITAYGNDVLDSLVVLGPSLVLLVALVVVVRLTGWGVYRLRVRVALIAGGVVLLTLLVLAVYKWVHISAEFFALGYFAVFLGVGSVVLLVAGAVIEVIRRRRAGPDRWAWRSWVVGCFGVAVLFGTPFVSALGTNNPLSGELLYSAQIWASALAVLVIFGSVQPAERGLAASVLPLAFVLFLLAASALGVRHAQFQVPFRSLPYQQQNTPATAPALSGLLLAKQDVEWTGWLSRQARALDAESTPTISMVSPGALYVFNNSAYTDPWLLDLSPVSFTSITVSCKKDPTGPLLILVPPRGAGNKTLFRSVTAALAKCGIAFPQDFVQVAKYTPGNPASDITILKLKTAP